MEQVWIINILPGVDSFVNALVCRNTKSELIDNLMACLWVTTTVDCKRPKKKSSLKNLQQLLKVNGK